MSLRCPTLSLSCLLLSICLFACPLRKCLIATHTLFTFIGMPVCLLPTTTADSSHCELFRMAQVISGDDGGQSVVCSVSSVGQRHNHTQPAADNAYASLAVSLSLHMSTSQFTRWQLMLNCYRRLCHWLPPCTVGSPESTWKIELFSGDDA